jgi:hypothetical protein
MQTNNSKKRMFIASGLLKQSKTSRRKETTLAIYF